MQKQDLRCIVRSLREDHGAVSMDRVHRQGHQHAVGETETSLAPTGVKGCSIPAR